MDVMATTWILYFSGNYFCDLDSETLEEIYFN